MIQDTSFRTADCATSVDFLFAFRHNHTIITVEALYAKLLILSNVLK